MDRIVGRIAYFNPALFCG